MLECPWVPSWCSNCHPRSSLVTELNYPRAVPTVHSKDFLMILSPVHGTVAKIPSKSPTVSNTTNQLASHQHSSGKSIILKILVQWLQRACSTFPCMISIERWSMSITTHMVQTSQWAKSDSHKLWHLREQVVKMVWWTTTPSSSNQPTILRKVISLSSLFHLQLDSQMARNAGVFLIGWVAIWRAQRVVTVKLYLWQPRYSVEDN